MSKYNKFIKRQEHIMKCMESISTDQLCNLVLDINCVQNVDKTENSVFLMYCGKNGLKSMSLINSSHSISCFNYAIISEEDLLSLILLSITVYNAANSDGTYAHLVKMGSRDFVCLEATQSLKGGVSSQFIKLFIKNFIDKIEVFEKIVFDKVNELGDDFELFKKKICSGPEQPVK